MQVLSVPESHHVYVRLLAEGLRRLGVGVREAPFPYLRWPRNFYRFVREVVRGSDMWQLHWNVFDFMAVAKLFLGARPPKTWTVHNLVPHQQHFRDDLAVTALYLDRVDVAVWHSQRSLDDAREALRRRGLPAKWSARDVVIPHMSFNGAFPDEVTGSQARRSLGIPEEAFVVGHYAPTQAYKGTEDFLVAAAKTPQDGMVFCIFGECLDLGLRRKIESAARSNPRLRLSLERLADDQLQYWFKTCDLVVQPYREITTSGSIFFPIAFRRQDPRGPVRSGASRGHRPTSPRLRR